MGQRTKTALTQSIDTALAVIDDASSAELDDAELLDALLAPFAPEEIEDPQQYLDWENPDHQNLIYRVQDLTHRAAQLLSQMTPIERRVALAAAAPDAGRTFTAIAEKAQTSPVTVAKYLRENPNVRQYLQVRHQRETLATLPAKAHRVQMAWRIAQRTERTKPAIALKALSILAQQAGELQKDKDVAQQAPTVVLANFNFQSSETPQAPTPAKADIEDAVFSVVPEESQQ